VFERYSWKPIQPRVEAEYLRATLYLDTVGTRTFEQRFLHAGVIHIQRDFAVWRCCMQITAGNRIAAHIGDPIRRLMASAGEQAIHESQSARGRHSPRRHVLAANPILEVGSRSRTRNLWPARANSVARVDPASPPPTVITSKLIGVFLLIRA
jgi:hypothetical protein